MKKMMKLRISSFLMLAICGFQLAIAQQKVVLDNYFNNEISPKTGKPFHYIWEDRSFGGFSEFGDIFIANGATLGMLIEKPNNKNLKGADIYIIVDPDNLKDNKNPNYMDQKAAKAIAKWVKKGGVLLLLTNDSSNCELVKFNQLSSKFGITYNNDFNSPELRESKEKRNFQSCAFTQLGTHEVFNGVSKIFLKEISSITISKNAKAVLESNGKVFIAEASYGKGYVFAVGDPWLYNEYIGHALLPEDFENKKAAKNLVKLLLSK